MIHVRKIWTPLELLGLELYLDEEKQWYSKRRNQPMKKMFKKTGA